MKQFLKLLHSFYLIFINIKVNKLQHTILFKLKSVEKNIKVFPILSRIHTYINDTSNLKICSRFILSKGEQMISKDKLKYDL